MQQQLWNLEWVKIRSQTKVFDTDATFQSVLSEKVAGEWNYLSSQTRSCCCQKRPEPAWTLWLVMMLRVLYCPGASVNSVSRLVTCLPSTYEESRPEELREEEFHNVSEESSKALLFCTTPFTNCNNNLPLWPFQWQHIHL